MIKSFRCDICQFTTLYRSSLSRHNKSIKHWNKLEQSTNNVPKIEDNIPKVKDNVPKAVPKVEDTPAVIKCFRCDICQFMTIYRTSLYRHNKSIKHFNKLNQSINNSRKIKDIPPEVIPKVEDKAVPTIEDDAPKANNLKPKEFTCTLCNYTTTTKSNYNRHCKSKKHLKKQNPTENQKPAQPFDCLACELKFKTRTQCVTHLRDSGHQANVRKKYKHTLFHTSDGLCLTGINVKLCAEYFRYNGNPYNVKIPFRKRTKKSPKIEEPEEIEEIEEPDEIHQDNNPIEKIPSRENTQKSPKIEYEELIKQLKNDRKKDLEELQQNEEKTKFKFQPISNEEIESAELITRCDFSAYAYEEDITKLRKTTAQALKLSNYLGINLEDEGIDLNYETLDSVNDIISNIKKICFDDQYMMNMYGRTF